MFRAVLALERYNNWWLDRTPILIGLPVVCITDLLCAVGVATTLSLPALLF